MGILSKVTIFIAAAAVFAGCEVKKTDVKVDVPKVKIPEIKIPDFTIDPKLDALMKEMNACDKADAELSLDKINPDETVTLQDKIETMDVVTVDCNGQKSKPSHEPIRNFEQKLHVETPVDLVDFGLLKEVQFVQIENLRTCSTQRLNLVDDKLLTEQVVQNDAGQVKIPAPNTSKAGISGKLVIALSDVTLKLPSLFLNVRDNNNVLKISYYGGCTKYKEVFEAHLDPARNCLDPKLFSYKYLQVKLEVERPDVPGIHEKVLCIKK